MNVLVIMCDHHRADALGCLGNPLARTPNLDRLAAESVRFTNCYTQSPVCAPARHSLATGRYVHAHGVLTNNHLPFPGMYTIAHAVAPLGHRRFCLGHMHWKDPDMDTGYESWTRHEALFDALSPQMRKRWEWENQGMTRRTTGGPGPRTREQHFGHLCAQNAIQQMTGAVEAGEEFLCWLSFHEPHPPFYPPKAIYEQFDQSRIPLPRQAPADAPPPHPYIEAKRREWAHLTDVEVRQMLAGYYGLVALVDEYIGEVLGALDRIGVRDDTIIVWTADHGDQMWEHEMFLKFCMYEASTHVPMMIHVPGAAAGTRDELIEHVDLFPTLCDLLGAECPDTVHGRSLLPLLQGQPAPSDWRDAVFSQIGDVRMMRTREWKLNTYDRQPGELYNVKDDPDEFINRLDDASCAGVVAEMTERMGVWEGA